MSEDALDSVLYQRYHLIFINSIVISSSYRRVGLREPKTRRPRRIRPQGARALFVFLRRWQVNSRQPGFGPSESRMHHAIDHGNERKTAPEPARKMASTAWSPGGEPLGHQAVTAWSQDDRIEASPLFATKRGYPSGAGNERNSAEEWPGMPGLSIGKRGGTWSL